MSFSHIPPGYHTVTPYLVVNGVMNIIDFLKKTFDATVTEGPMMGEGGRVMHAEVRIGDSMIMMGEPMTTDTKPIPGMFYVYMPDCDATYKRAIAAGATSKGEPADQFYGDRSGTVIDSAGNLWCIATKKENVSPEELMKRAAELSKK